MLLLLALAHNDQALQPGVVKILANYMKSEVAISSRFSQIQQPTFFVICSRFIRLMVPTGLIVAVKQNTNFVSTVCTLVCTLDTRYLLFCIVSPL